MEQLYGGHPFVRCGSVLNVAGRNEWRYDDIYTYMLLSIYLTPKQMS